MDEMPPLYARWLPSLLPHGPPPPEELATCDRCVMLPVAGGPATATYFDATTRCCTFLPELHNFLVGQVLVDPEADPVGRASVVRRLEAGAGVTPLGLGRTRSFLAIYEDGREQTFGRSQALRCPHHLDDGRCGVWSSRESTCATWFCKHVRGAAGRNVWMALRRVLQIAEVQLSWWCLTELGLEPRVIDQLLQRRAQAARAPTYADLWGSWAGREIELYTDCAARVAPLTWQDVSTIGGAELRGAVDVLQSLSAEAATRRLPDRLTVGPLSITAIRDGACTVTTYSVYDSVALPSELVQALDVFDGSPTEDALERLATERGLELDDDLLHKLVDFAILVDATR